MVALKPALFFLDQICKSKCLHIHSMFRFTFFFGTRLKIQILNNKTLIWMWKNYISLFFPPSIFSPLDLQRKLRFQILIAHIVYRAGKTLISSKFLSVLVLILR